MAETPFFDTLASLVYREIIASLKKKKEKKLRAFEVTVKSRESENFGVDFLKLRVSSEFNPKWEWYLLQNMPQLFTTPIFLILLFAHV